MDDKDAVDELATMLEQLSNNLERAAKDKSSTLDDTLQNAMATTTQLIQHALPEQHQKEWLQQLQQLEAGNSNPSFASELSSENVGAKSTAAQPNSTNPDVSSIGITCEQGGTANIKCACATLTSQPTESSVSCIHGCKQRFCTAACRRRRAREHNAACSALLRKKVLRQIGLHSEPELF